MSEANFTPTATGRGLLLFLDFLIQKGYMRVPTGQSMKTAVKEVLSATQGTDAWEEVDLDAIDAADVIRRFETLRAMKFSSGSLNTYSGRFQRALTMFQDFRSNPATWRPVKQRSTRSAKVNIAPARPAAPAEASEPRGNVATTDPPIHPSTHRPTVITYPFPLRDGVLASIDLPADLTGREARRLAAFINSLAIEEPLTGPIDDVLPSATAQTD